MNIIIPMAGEGKRLSDAGITTPKPLVEVKERMLVEWALTSLEFYDARRDRLVFICLRRHIAEYGLDKKLKARFPSCTIIVADGVTKGQVCSVLLARDLIDGQPLIIHNNDTVFRSSLAHRINELLLRHDGVISVFRSNHPCYSYAKVGSDGFITEVAEKRVISDYATVGLYAFSDGRDFVRAAEAMIKKGITHNNEYYVGPCYNELIAEGKRFVIDESNEVYDLGTPEGIERFQEGYRET